MTQESMTEIVERQEFILKWNESAENAKNLSDDDLIARIESLKKAIRMLRVEKEALDTEADSRGKMRKETQKLIDSKYTSPIVDAERRRQEKSGTNKVDKALKTLMSTFNIGEDEARKRLGTLYQKAGEVKKDA
jgi:hypothetical protein